MKIYNKLIRDKVLEVLDRKGKKYKAHTARNDKEYWKKQKNSELSRAL